MIEYLVQTLWALVLAEEGGGLGLGTVALAGTVQPLLCWAPWSLGKLPWKAPGRWSRVLKTRRLFLGLEGFRESRRRRRGLGFPSPPPQPEDPNPQNNPCHLNRASPLMN